MHPHPSLLPFLPQLLENLPLESEIHRALISPGRVALVRRHEVVSEAGELGPSVLLSAGPAEQGGSPFLICAACCVPPRRSISHRGGWGCWCSNRCRGCRGSGGRSGCASRPSCSPSRERWRLRDAGCLAWIRKHSTSSPP